MEPNATTAQTYGCPLPPEKFDELLEKVKKEIIDFEAKQLGKLKTELEAFEKKKKAVTDGYALKYPKLLEKWRLQNAQIELLHRSLTCLFKDGSWKQHITTCICPRLAAIADREASLAKRRKCFLGEREQKRDHWKAVAEADKIYLDKLIANQAMVESAQAANDKLIAEIKLLCRATTAPSRSMSSGSCFCPCMCKWRRRRFCPAWILPRVRRPTISARRKSPKRRLNRTAR